MNKVARPLEDMRAEHQQWDFEHLAWRVDIQRWRAEHQSALSELAELQRIVRQHGDALAAHADAVERHQDNLRDHDRAMTEVPVEGGEWLQEAMEREHREQTDRHNGQRAAHGRIKKHHEAVIAHLTKLKAAIEEAM